MTDDPIANFVAPLPALDRALRDAVGDGKTGLDHAARYVMGWQDEDGRPIQAGGKRLRPLLALFASRVMGGTIEDAMPAAVAVELIHNFSLVHDEVQDHDAARHGRPTLWALLGEAQAINAGDYIYTRAFQSLTRGVGDATRRLAALDVLERAVERMVQGQWGDLSFESRDEVSPDDYLAMVAGKTGALIAAPLEMGALMAGADPGRAARLGLWGAQVGLAFQVQDDYLGIWGEPSVTGKSNTNDIARKKKTYPVILGLQDREARFEIARVLGQEVISAVDVDAVVGALDGIGAGKRTREKADEHAKAAESLLDELEFPPETRAEFDAVGRLLVDRKS